MHIIMNVSSICIVLMIVYLHVCFHEVITIMYIHSVGCKMRNPLV